MSHYCPTCGAELTSGTKFCSACGEKAEQQPMTHIPSPQQPQYQQQTSAPLSSPWKSKKKLIIGLLAIIIAVVIVLVIVLFILGGTGFFRGGDADSRFVGEWDAAAGDSGIEVFKFYGDGTYDLETSSGSETNILWVWDVDDTDTDHHLILVGSTFSAGIVYMYEFSNNYNTLTLEDLYSDSSRYPDYMVLTKKGFQAPNQTTQTPNMTTGNPIAVFDTTLGTFKVELLKDKMPITVNNFVKLVNDGFYNGLIFHRIGANFMIQAGGYYPNGTRRSSPYGNIPFETSDVKHVDGAISMASTGSKVGGSAEFFICDGAQMFLDGNYAAFGVTIEGLDVVRSIAAQPHPDGGDGTGKPTTDIIINSIIIVNS